MRYPAGHKEQTRSRIVEAASKVFRRAGYNASGLDRVMEEAGLTAGGFYAHFASKQALLAEVLERAAAEGGRAAAAVEGLAGAEWLDGFLGRYLSPEHRGMIEDGCPLAALISEVSRADGAVKAGAEAMVRKFEGKLAATATGGDPASAEGRALAAVALCVGGIGLARAVEDDALAAQVLEACRAEARAILIGPGDGPRSA